MRYNFCTFFDSKYLPQGLALYNSLKRFCPDFTIWVLCLDNPTYEALKKMKLEGMILISTEEFETPQMLELKKEPSRAYFATIKPPFIKYILEQNPEIDVVMYLDSDVFLFSSPALFYENFAKNSALNILLTPHRFSDNGEYLESRNGIFNNGIMAFKNNPVSLECLRDWFEDCIDWCQNRVLDGKFSNQKYHDKWSGLYPGVYSSDDRGVNVGPWNISQYKINHVGGSVSIDKDPLIIYHFSSFRMYSPGEFRLFDFDYKISRRVRRLIYRPYTTELRNVAASIGLLAMPAVPHFERKPRIWERLRYRIKLISVKLHIYLKEHFRLYSRLFYSYSKKND